MEQRGELLWEYLPPRAHPILYAGLLLFTFVLGTGSLENWARDNRPELYVLYAAPVVGVLLVMLLLRPSAVRLHANGIAPSRPLIARWHRPFLAWDQLEAVYPASYDVTGAFVSPFASSDGKVTQTGLGLETPDGRVETVRFTPTRFAENTRRSRGYREAMEIVRELYAKRGRPLTPRGQVLPLEEKQRLLAEARKPFLPFFAIVFLFACAAPVLWLLLFVAHWPIQAALPLCLLPPLATSLRSYQQSRRRNALLNHLSRAHEYETHTVGGAA